MAPLLAASLLGACTPPRPLEPAVTTSPRQPFLVRVGAVEVVTTDGGVRGATFIDKNRAGRLADAAAAFLRGRLHAAGGTGRLRAVVETAAMEALPLPTTVGIPGIFVREPNLLLQGRLKVRLSVLDGGGAELAWAGAEVERARRILERTASLARDDEAERVVDELLRQLDDALERAVPQNLGPYLLL